MKVEVELIAYMKTFAPGESPVFDMDLEEGETVAAVLSKLRIPEDAARLTLVNGRHATDDVSLKEGDTVVFLTPVEGG